MFMQICMLQLYPINTNDVLFQGVRCINIISKKTPIIITYYKTSRKLRNRNTKISFVWLNEGLKGGGKQRTINSNPGTAASCFDDGKNLNTHCSGQLISTNGQTYRM